MNTPNSTENITPVVSNNESGLNSGPTSAFMSKLRPYVAAALMLGTPAMQSCETDKTVEPVEQIDTKLTAEDKEFADIFDVNNPKMAKLLVTSILDGKPVVSIPVSPVPNNKAFTEAFKNFMDIELRLIDAKARTYSITPIINKSSVEKILKLAEE
ncbi:MAG: hypothetical protein U5M51_12370 [Emticicia sp.]|nr:hypothetical protein [Emticicia sp.]